MQHALFLCYRCAFLRDQSVYLLKQAMRADVNMLKRLPCRAHGHRAGPEIGIVLMQMVLVAALPLVCCLYSHLQNLSCDAPIGRQLDISSMAVRQGDDEGIARFPPSHGEQGSSAAEKPSTSAQADALTSRALAFLHALCSCENKRMHDTRRSTFDHLDHAVPTYDRRIRQHCVRLPNARVMGPRRERGSAS